MPTHTMEVTDPDAVILSSDEPTRNPSAISAAGAAVASSQFAAEGRGMAAPAQSYDSGVSAPDQRYIKEELWQGCRIRVAR